MLALALLLAGLDDKPYYGEIRERLESPIIASLTTAKKPHDLEICTANAILSLGAPVALRDGPDNVVIMAGMSPMAQAYLVSVSLVQIDTGTRLDLRLRGKGWDDRMTERLRACL